MATKSGRPLSLCYQAQISVDTASHIICGALGLYANIRDSQCLPFILNQAAKNLSRHDIRVENVLADTNYSGGPTLKYLEEAGIKSYIPCIGNYKNEHKDFSYDSQSDCFICRMNKKLSFIKIHKPTTRTYESKIYRSSQKDCSVCPLKGQCIKIKRILSRNSPQLFINLTMRTHTKGYILQ